MIKVILLYDDFSNTAIIEKSMSEIFDQDVSCYVMTIRELEILLYLHKNDKEKCGEICTKIVMNSGERESIGAIFENMDLVNNPHLDGNMDFFAKIMEQLQEQWDWCDGFPYSKNRHKTVTGREKPTQNTHCKLQQAAVGKSEKSLIHKGFIQ